MTKKQNNLLKFMMVAALFAVGACTYGKIDLGNGKYSQAAAIKGQGGMYKVGNPYQIMGTWYYPKEETSYSETGVASWYGEDFHALKTANGENYDMNTLTAAHRTLPLPSIVKVTNLENGRSLVLRINDRGPYAKSRIIDISKRGAQLLGYQAQGTAKVRVELMVKESRELKEALIGDKMEPGSKIAVAKPTEELKPLQLSGAGSAAVKSFPKGSFFVQVGAYSQKNSAQSLSTQLDKFGDTNVFLVDVGGKKLYRVRLGPFSHEQEAKVTLAKVKNFGIYNATIVKE